MRDGIAALHMPTAGLAVVVVALQLAGCGKVDLVSNAGEQPGGADAPDETQSIDTATQRPNDAVESAAPITGTREPSMSLQENSTHRNRLADEKSPYLLQHATNPVDWYPWGDEAFEKAREEDKPIFLSIGYSTCHWCHVMEGESFEDEEVAALMNEAFVSVKVDREERPDIDNVYMTACQLIGQSCGWPLNVLLTPDGRPFFAATYVPKDSRFGRAGMLQLVPRITEMWQTDRDTIVKSAGEITDRVQQLTTSSPGTDLDPSALQLAHDQLAGRYDSVNGGFGDAPKFPSPHNLTYLLRHWRRNGDEETLEMVTRTLDAMRRGGMYDQIGYGFHRYSTDAGWKLPHFEKMLYDQAMLAMAYTEGYAATGKQPYADTVREIFDYMQRDMMSPEGAFYTAEDADSEGEEGKFYVWTEAELLALLGDDAQLARLAYSTQPAGNFAEEASGEWTGDNVLHVTRSNESLIAETGLSPEELTSRLDVIRETLLAHREARVRPLRDDKVLTDWNGLMIAAYAQAGRVMEEPEYSEVATRAAQLITERMRTTDGRLLHRYRDGEAAVPGTVDDYAFVVWGLIELYQSTFEVDHLATALELNSLLVDHFWDDENGGLYYTPDDGEDLIVRSKESYDGAVPSGNSVAMYNMLRLARLTGDAGLEERAAAIGRSFGETVGQNPSAHSQMMSALDFAVGPSYEVVIVGDPEAEDTDRMVRALNQSYAPNKVVLLRPAGEESAPIDAVADFVGSLKSIDSRATVYVCRNFECDFPTTDVQTMLDSLGAVERLPTE